MQDAAFNNAKAAMSKPTDLSEIEDENEILTFKLTPLRAALNRLYAGLLVVMFVFVAAQMHAELPNEIMWWGAALFADLMLAVLVMHLTAYALFGDAGVDWVEYQELKICEKIWGFDKSISGEDIDLEDESRKSYR
jgi:hypothetical protein